MKEYQKQKFGYEGELFKKRQELIKPIQDKVFDAIQKIAKESALDFIFDKSSELTMLYTNAKYDRSDDVLEEMGISVTTNKKQ
jgi:outer membrane protein